MQIVDVQVPDAGGQFARHDAGLAEAAPAIARPVAQEIAQERRQEPKKAWPHQCSEHAARHTARLVMQIFRQIAHRRRDLAMHQVPIGIGRMAQRPDLEGQAALLQAEQFLRDERLREARVALHRDRDAWQCGTGHRRPISMKRV